MGENDGTFHLLRNVVVTNIPIIILQLIILRKLGNGNNLIYLLG
jgi:hypothetical protein